jgi:hypothetical protein
MDSHDRHKKVRQILELTKDPEVLSMVRKIFAGASELPTETQKKRGGAVGQQSKPFCSTLRRGFTWS